MRTAWLIVVAGACSSSASTPSGEPAPHVTAPASRDAGTPSEPPAPVVIGPDAASPDAPTRPPIVDAPMAWSPEREQLTLDYRRTHSDPAATDLTIVPHLIVLHYTDGGSAAATRRYFDNVRIEASRKSLAKHGAVNVSAHFVVDRDGTIYQLQPPTRFARHCIGLNHLAIGIENAGNESTFPLTDAQIAADAALVRYLASQYPITRLLGHFEVMGFRDHPEFVELDPTYRNDKPDPGKHFLAAVRAQVADLHLLGAAEP